MRDAAPEDADRIVELNLRLAIETEGRAPDREVLARGVARGLESRERCRYWVAEIDGAVVGQTMVTWEWSDWRDGVVWWIQSVYVEPAHRGVGVFRALFDHVKALAQDDPDARALRLYVETENGRARTVYAALGMDETSYRVYEHDWSDAIRPVR